MRSCIRPTIMLVTAMFAATVSLTGCATFSKKESATTTATLQRIQDDYHQAKLDAEATEDALIEVTVASDLELAQASRAFVVSAKRMQATGERLLTHADQMHFRGPSYIVESELSATACVFPRLQKKEGERPSELGTYFDAISEEGWEVKRAYQAYQFDLDQLKDHLMDNMTQTFIDSVTPILEKAKVDGDSLQYSLDQALVAIDKAKAAKAQNQK
jgi:uncharacterized protein YceK